MSNLKFESFYKLLEEFSSDYKLSKNANWLEIGCGNGNLINHLNNKGKRCIGIDVEFKKGPYINELLRKNLIKLIKYHGKARDDINENNNYYSWPCKSESIEFTYSSSVLEHIFNLDEFAKENSRILTSAGYCLHYLPSRTAFIEAHTGIPFGGLFINKNYYLIMFILGIYNKKFKSLNDILVYMRNSTKYRSKKEIIKIFRNNNLKFIEERNDLIIKYMGPKFSINLYKIRFLNTIFGIFRSKLLIFKKV